MSTIMRMGSSRMSEEGGFKMSAIMGMGWLKN
jgi:hypothetical protein